MVSVQSSSCLANIPNCGNFASRSFQKLGVKLRFFTVNAAYPDFRSQAGIVFLKRTKQMFSRHLVATRTPRFHADKSPGAEPGTETAISLLTIEFTKSGDTTMKHPTLSANFKTLAAGFIGCLLLAGTAAVSAAVKDTKHNLGSAGTGPNTFSGTNEVCVFCHTPHGADTSAAVPLWNRTLALPSTYTTYDTLGTTSLDGATAPVGSVSLACLSCHDGTQAMDTLLNDPGSGAVVSTFTLGLWTGVDRPQGIADLGQDLTNDHPVGIQYGGGGLTVTTPAGALNDGDFITTQNATINGTTVWWVDTGLTGTGTREKTDMQLYTRTVAAIDGGAAQPFVECASCHDPHSSNTTFLRIANDNSDVCLACHNK